MLVNIELEREARTHKARDPKSYRELIGKDREATLKELKEEPRAGGGVEAAG